MSCSYRWETAGKVRAGVRGEGPRSMTPDCTPPGEGVVRTQEERTWRPAHGQDQGPANSVQGPKSGSEPSYNAWSLLLVATFMLNGTAGHCSRDCLAPKPTIPSGSFQKKMCWPRSWSALPCPCIRLVRNWRENSLEGLKGIIVQHQAYFRAENYFLKCKSVLSVVQPDFVFSVKSKKYGNVTESPKQTT